MSFRVRYAYDQPSEKDSGWTTGFYNNATTLADAKTRAIDMAGVLADLLGAQTTIKFIRIANTNNNRAAINFRWTGTTSGAAKTGVAPDSDVPQTALLLTLRTADLIQKANLTIKGIPDSWTTTGGLFTGAGSKMKINALIDTLKDPAQGWIMKFLDPNRARQPINSITAAGVVTTDAALALPNPPFVILTRVRNLPTTSRKFRATNAAGNTFQLFPWPAGNTVVPVVSKVSTAWAAAYAEGTIGDVEADTGTTHKVGRPIKLASGRRARARM